MYGKGGEREQGMGLLHTKNQKRYRHEIDIQMPGHVYGKELRVVKAIVNRVKREVSYQGITIDPWIDTREVAGKAVIYSDRDYIIQRLISELKKREAYVIQRQNYFNFNPTPKMIHDEMNVIEEEIMKQEEQKFKNTKEVFDNMEEIEEILESMDIWQMATKWGMEDQFELYDEEKNPFGVYLCTNELKIGNVFTIPCQIFT